MTLNKNIVVAGFFLLLSGCLHAQTDTIAQRLILIGDAGQLDPKGNHPVVDAVRSMIPLDKKTTVLFLGDNIYRNGLPDRYSSDYYSARAVLDSQLSIADSTPAKVIMIPGNHDWRNGQRDGYDAIVREQLYVSFLLKDNVHFYPEDGCPGPKAIDLGPDVVLIVFDSQWWLHPFDKPEIESDCDCKTKDELVTQIRDLATKNSKKLVIVACHHPFKSNGPHGGFFKPKQYFFPFTDFRPNLYIPLPIIGAIYPITRLVYGSPQDLAHPVYADMINQIEDAVKTVAPNAIFVAGHEHNLEFLKEEGSNYIISGGGSKINRASTGKHSQFISTSTGFTVLEMSTNKNVTVTFYTVTDSVRKMYTGPVLNYSPAKAADTATVESITAVNLPDSVNKAASKNFPVISGLKEFFMGQNYRYEWSQPVHMKTFDIDKDKGGFEVTGRGGSTQTKTLQLKDKKGKEWVLRSIEKNAVVAIPTPFRNYIGTGMVDELNSAAHPYGAMIVPGLAKPLNLVVPKPELVFVEDDPRLKGYRKDFSGRVCLLEDRFTNYNGSKTESSSKVFNGMVDKNDHRPYEPTVLKARLLDMLIGDFDRNLDQWKWYKADTGKGILYVPIPRDRDFSFFHSNGKILNLLSSRVIPFLKGFRYDIPNPDWLGYTAKDFDRVFMTDLDADDWKKAIADFQQKMSDTVIRESVKNLPPEIYAIDGEKITQKLISRRNAMGKSAMAYYNFISKKVNVIGSNQKEYFKVSNNGAGLQVRVYERGRGDDTSFIMYDRIFNPSITKEIRLYGLGDDDLFEVEDNAASRIKLRIIGGNGNDTFDIKGSIENLLYDRIGDLNMIKDSSHSKKRFTVDPPASSRNLLAFNYNTTRFPQITAGYNTDDQFLAGLAISKRTHGFRNLPYATDQKLAFLYSSRKAWQVNYAGVFNHITRNLDVVVNSKFSSPAIRNFYGLGNRTTISPDKSDDFYRIRYKEFELEILARHRYFENLHIEAGPYYYYYKSSFKDNNTGILAKPRQVGLDSADIFSKKMYLGAKAVVSFDNRNDELFPTRGIYWKNELLAAAGIGSGASKYSKLSTDMTIYATQKGVSNLVAVIKFGGGHIFGKNFEYFQALDLGAGSNLHGFRKNRYAGKSNVYAGIEARYRLFDVNSYILPGQFGLIGFVDAGKVALKDIRSRKWHTAVGAGAYFIPLNLFFVSAYAGYSGKEKIFNISIGTKFNLTY